MHQIVDFEGRVAHIKSGTGTSVQQSAGLLVEFRDTVHRMAHVILRTGVRAQGIFGHSAGSCQWRRQEKKARLKPKKEDEMRRRRSS